jgi:hypothetical protein
MATKNWEQNKEKGRKNTLQQIDTAQKENSDLQLQSSLTLPLIGMRGKAVALYKGSWIKLQFV